jgi:hypothetical protein
MIWLVGLALAAEPAALEAAARAANRQGDPAAEREACTALIAAAAGSPGGHRCERRLRELEARQDPDGGLQGLRTLMAARRGEAPETAVAALLSGSAPPLLQAEAALWLADAARARGDREAEAAFLDQAPAVEGPAGRLIAQRAAALRAASPWRPMLLGVVGLHLIWGLGAAARRRPWPWPAGLGVWAAAGVGALGLVALHSPSALGPLTGLWLGLGLQHLVVVAAQAGWAFRLFSAGAALALSAWVAGLPSLGVGG